jgi:hypothetical protein
MAKQNVFPLFTSGLSDNIRDVAQVYTTLHYTHYTLYSLYTTLQVYTTHGFMELHETMQHYNDLFKDSSNEWEENQDPKTGKTYFYNKRLRESRWTLPSSNEENHEFSHDMVFFYHLELVGLFAVIASGKNAVAEVQCQRMLPLTWVLAILLHKDTPYVAKATYAGFLWEAFFETEINDYSNMSSDENLWMYLVSCVRDINKFVRMKKKAPTKPKVAEADSDRGEKVVL